MIKLALSGACGHMGRTIYKTLIGSTDFEIAFGVDPHQASDLPFPIYPTFDEAVLTADVIIDFSTAASLDGILSYAVANKTKLVIATTGHNADHVKRIEYAAKKIAIFRASNMSLGVNLLATLSKDAMKFLGDSYDVEIVETHHNLKLDAPSGTALTLAKAINEVRNNSLIETYGRHETAHRRDKSEIGIHAVRGGTVVGKHDVMFLGMGEVIKLSHEAENKDVFVRGALRASSFLLNKNFGLYNMNSILGDYYAVTTVNTENNISVINIPSLSGDDFISLFEGIKGLDINLDMISQNLNSNGTLAISFTVCDTDLKSIEKLMRGGVAFTATSGTAKLMIEGAGMEHKSGVALDLLKLLKKLGTRIYTISTSETKISCCIDSDKLSSAEVALRKFYSI